MQASCYGYSDDLAVSSRNFFDFSKMAARLYRAYGALEGPCSTFFPMLYFFFWMLYFFFWMLYFFRMLNFFSDAVLFFGCSTFFRMLYFFSDAVLFFGCCTFFWMLYFFPDALLFLCFTVQRIIPMLSHASSRAGRLLRNYS